MPPSHQVHRTRPSLAAALMSATIALTGCGIRPEPMTLSENVGRAQADRAVIERAYVPITGPLSLPEALARALKHNYDVQLSKLEATLEDKQLDLAVAAMLPRLSTDAGFTSRSNENAAESIDVRTRQRSFDYSYSEEQSHATADIVFSWNVLDLGISYFAAK